MKHTKFVLGLALALPLALGVGVLGNHVAEAKEVGAATWTFTYGLVDPTVSKTAYLEGASVTATADSETWPSDTVEFTTTLAAGDVVQILINASDDSTWSYLVPYTESSIGSNYTAYFGPRTADSAYEVLVAGEYTFSFNVKWAKYDNKAYGLNVTTPTVTERKVTYTAVIGEDGHGLNSTVTLSKVVESTDPTYNDYTPYTIYGAEFAGWYSAAECTTESAIDPTTEITEDVTVWAKYDYLATNVDYIIDYSAARDKYDLGSVSVHYWNGSGSSTNWPGIIITDSGEGLITASLPADATGLQVVTVVDGSAAGQCSTITIDPDATTEIAHVVLDGTYTEDTYGYLTFAAFKADAEYVNIYTALSHVAAQCSISSYLTEASKIIEGVWTTIATNVTAGVEKIAYLQGVPARAGSKGMAGLISIYDYCVKKYTLDDHIGRTTTTGTEAYHFTYAQEDYTYVLLTGVIGLVAIGVIAGVLISRRRRHIED